MTTGSDDGKTGCTKKNYW